MTKRIQLGTIRVVCAWCGASLGTIDNPGGPDGTSHGICRACADKFKEGGKSEAEILERAKQRAMAAVALLRTVEVDGAEISVFPWEDPAQVAEEMRNVWEEIERRPEMDWLPTDDEVLESLDEGDHWRWAAEYNACMSDGAPHDFAAAVADVFVGGVAYCPPGVDWAAVEDEAWGE